MAELNNRPIEPESLTDRLWDWFDHRTGIRGLMHDALGEPIPGGARWAYVFGSGLLFLFLSQVITGIFLALYYTPTAAESHVSVAYIVKMVADGSFLRSVHAYGASAIIIVLLLHLTQTYTYGAYKGRRELLWSAGGILLLLMLGMAFTGYLLPWDQNAYFATTVGTNIVSEVPFIGPSLRTLLRGGNQMGTLTVSRFFAIHVFFLPALIFTFVALHVYLFRKAGAAGPTNADPYTPNLRTERFYPRQVVYDLFFTFLIISALGLLSLFRPKALGPVANPADTTFLPRPEWYYRPVFELLKYFPGSLEIVGVLVIPGIIIALLFFAPWIDRSRERRPWKRPWAMGIFSIILLAYIALGVLSFWQDAHETGVAAQLKRQQEAMQAYMKAPFKPYVIGASAKVTSTNPLVDQGKSVFTSKGCSSCHGPNGEGTPIAPALVDIGSKFPPETLANRIRHPTAKMTSAGMPSFDIPDNQMKALVAYLDSLKQQ